MADTNTLVDTLSGLTVLEVADLVKKLEEKWGVSAAAPVAVAAAGGAAAGGAPDLSIGIPYTFTAFYYFSSLLSV